MALDLDGIFPPTATPLLDDEIDPAAFRANVDRWMRTGLRGLVVLGSNGEAPLLDDEESVRLVATAREGVPRDRLLIAGTGRNSTRETIALSRAAAGAGADAVLVLTPSVFRPQMTADALLRHYRAVADACPVPVLLYNHPATTGVALTPAVVRQLAEHPNIAGIKESSGDLTVVGELATLVSPTFQLVVGSAPTLYASLLVGAQGGVVAVANVVPDLCVQLHTLVRTNRLAEALALQRALSPLASAVTTGYGIAGLKAAMDLAGYHGGAPRRPLAPLPEEARRAVAGLYETLLARA